MAFPSIRNINPFPQRDGSQTPAQFSAAVDNVFSSIDGMIGDLNAFGVYADDIGEENQGYADASAASASSASNSALNASRDAAQAAASANYKGNWASLSGSLSKPASVFHAGEYWLLNNNLSNVAASTPSDANSDWQKIQTYQAWGLGTSTPERPDDLNTMNESRFFGAENSDLNTPPTASNWAGIRMAGLNANNGAEFAVTSSSSNTRGFIRGEGGGNYDDWLELYTSGNSINPLDFGLGVDGEGPLATDCNTTTKTGFYRTNGSSLNTPSGIASFGTLLVMAYDSSKTNVNQVFIGAGNATQGSYRQFVRVHNVTSNTWSDWVEMYHSDTPRLTVVSTSGDIVRTGAQTEVFVDTGSNISLNLVAGDYNSGDEIIINKSRKIASLTITSDANIADPNDSISLTHTLSAGFTAVIRVIKRGPTWRLSIS